MTSASSAASIGESGASSAIAVAVARKSGEEVLGLAVPHGAHPEPAAVRAGADAGIIAVAPVSEVVPALLAAPRVIADLVGGHPRG